MAGTLGELLEQPATLSAVAAFLRTRPALLRAAEFAIALVCAVTAGVSVPAGAPSWYVFLILVAVLAMVLDLAVLVMYARGRALLSSKYFTATYLPMAEMLLSFLLAVIWLAASVSFAAQVPQATSFPGFSRQLSTTAVVLGFFSCIVWAYSSVLAFIRFRDAPTYVADEVLVDSDASTAGPSDTEASSAASTTTRASYGAV